MRKRKVRSFSHSFLEPTKSLDSFVAMGLGFLALILLIVSIVEAIVKAGEVTHIFALSMLASFLVSIVGMVFAVVGWKSEDGLPGMKRMVILLNALVVIVNVVLVIFGII